MLCAARLIAARKMKVIVLALRISDKAVLRAGGAGFNPARSPGTGSVRIL